MAITRQQLQGMSSEERHRLWQNAKARLGKWPDAEAAVQLIENSGLDYKREKRTSVTLDSKIGRALQRVVNSKAGVDAMLAAVATGMPPLAGVDPLLRSELGDDYCKENGATSQAGYVVTGVMEGLGYEKTGSSSPLPAECVASSGLTFIRQGGGKLAEAVRKSSRTRIAPSEDTLCGLFAEKIATSHDFRQSVLSHTKFKEHALTAKLLREKQIHQRPHVRPERWWRHWWCNIPGLQEQRETDIFLVFEAMSSNGRFALLIENKKQVRFSPGQAAAYDAKARFMAGKGEYLNFLDFQTMLIAPAAFRESHAGECDLFDVYVSYEAIGQFIPKFAEL